MGITSTFSVFSFPFAPFFFQPGRATRRLVSSLLDSAPLGSSSIPPVQAVRPLALRPRFSSGSLRTRDERRETRDDERNESTRIDSLRARLIASNAYRFSLSRPDSNESRRSASHEINAHRKTLKRFLALGDESRQPNGAEPKPSRFDTRKGNSHGTRVGRVWIEKQSQSPIRR